MRRVASSSIQRILVRWSYEGGSRLAGSLQAVSYNEALVIHRNRDEPAAGGARTALQGTSRLFYPYRISGIQQHAAVMSRACWEPIRSSPDQPRIDSARVPQVVADGLAKAL